MEVMLIGAALAHFRHHRRLYVACAVAVVAYLTSSTFARPYRFIATTDSFFIAYLLLVAFLFNETPQKLRERAGTEDEGIFLIIMIVLAAIASACISVIVLLHHSRGQVSDPLVMALIGAPLGWLTLHTVAAFHYANLFYAQKDTPGWTPGLEFPGNIEPRTWDFIYYAFVVGMTAQVADVQTVGLQMRRATLAHGMVSFLFNTVLIAMAVNAMVTLAT
jgi:uncharacterized membrane protein